MFPILSMKSSVFENSNAASNDDICSLSRALANRVRAAAAGGCGALQPI
jgi:hypothetical protein